MGFSKNIASLAVLAATAAASSTVLLAPDASAHGDDVAIVWINGAECDNEAYTSIAQAVQTNGALNGQRVYVGIPHFITGAPDPVTMVLCLKTTLNPTLTSRLKF
jgi:hypothetical protein